MAIGKIERISSAVPAENTTSVSKNLQNQIMMKQQRLKKLSTDSALSVEEKEKQRQEIQKEIEELKRKLEQMRLNQEEKKKTEEAEQKKELELETVSETRTEKKENYTAAEKSVEQKKERIELSVNEAQKMLEANLFLKEEMIQQGVEYDRKNTVRILSSEIKQDKILGFDTSSKEEQLKELREKEKLWMDIKYKENEQQPAPLFNSDMQVIIK